jgi:hypothetical protein
MRHNSAALLTILISLTPAYAQTYTPEQAVSVFYESMRDKLGFNAAGASSKYWLSLSLVGSIVDPTDLSQVNDLANFCPDTSPVLQTYTRARKLDMIYEKLLNSLSGPLRPEPQEVKDAYARLRTAATPPQETAEYSSWKTYQKSYNTKFAELFTSKTAVERSTKQIELAQIDRDWKVLGYKSHVAQAWDVINSHDVKYGALRQENRRDVLGHYRTGGLAPTDIPGAFKAPASELSPPVDKWADAGSWTGFTYTSKQTSSQFNQSTSNARGFGGLSLGFVTIVGGGGSTNSSTSKVSSVSEFNYTFQLKRVSIRRPWLDTEVFFEPKGWTWKKSPNTSKFPHVAVDPDAAGKPQSPPENVYDNVSVGCSVLPIELIIAENRSLTATVSKQDYDEQIASGSVSGGGGLFGIFGGRGGKDWSTTKISESGNSVTFKMDAPGIAVIGIISETLPELPEPNLEDKWPADAWLPK